MGKRMVALSPEAEAAALMHAARHPEHPVTGLFCAESGSDTGTATRYIPFHHSDASPAHATCMISAVQAL